MINDNRNDIKRVSEGLAIKLILIKFLEFIKSEYTLCTDYGSMLSSELIINNPDAEYIVNKFLKEEIERIIKKEEPDDAYSTGHI